MERDFEKSLCLGSGVPFLFLLLLVTIPNGFILFVLYRNPLHCFRKPFSVFLFFIAAVNFFNGIVVCSGETLVRFHCAFEDGRIPQEGDIVMVLEYIGINSSILLMTAMSIDRFIAIIYPHFYLSKITPRKLFVCNTIICGFSSIFASLQLTGISMINYRLTDIHLHTTFPLTTTFSAYLAIYLFLKKRSREDLQRQKIILAANMTLHSTRRLRIAQMERKFAMTSFLILLSLILSLIPYFIASVLEYKYHEYRKQTCFFAFKEVSLLFLFLNSAVNPFLSMLRIDELRQSLKIVLHLKQHEDQRDFPPKGFPRELNNMVTPQGQTETGEQQSIEILS